MSKITRSLVEDDLLQRNFLIYMILLCKFGKVRHFIKIFLRLYYILKNKNNEREKGGKERKTERKKEHANKNIKWYFVYYNSVLDIFQIFLERNEHDSSYLREQCSRSDFQV